MERVNNALFSLAGLPLVVVDRVTHHSPGYCGVNTEAKAVYELAEDVDQKICAGVIGSNDKESASADDRADSADNRKLLLTELCNHLSCKRCEKNDRDHCKELNNAGNLGILEVDLENNGNCGSSTLHTDEHTHSSESCADCGTVGAEVAHCLEYVELFALFADLELGVNTNLGSLDHELEADESENAHDESCKEYAGTVERFVRVVNDEGKDNHGEHVTNHGTDRTPSGEGCAVSRLIRDKRKERAVGYVCNGVESVPNYVARDKDDDLSPSGSTGERQEAASSANDKADRANPDVLKEFVSLIGMSVRVNYRTDKRVVDSVPNLNYNEKQGVPKSQTHNLSPEGSHCTLEREAHITSKVAGSIGYAVEYTKLALAARIKLRRFLLFHFEKSSF